jgi:hypothetical protein
MSILRSRAGLGLGSLCERLALAALLTAALLVGGCRPDAEERAAEGSLARVNDVVTLDPTACSVAVEIEPRAFGARARELVAAYHASCNRPVKEMELEMKILWEPFPGGPKRLLTTRTVAAAAGQALHDEIGTFDRSDGTYKGCATLRYRDGIVDGWRELPPTCLDRVQARPAEG